MINAAKETQRTCDQCGYSLEGLAKGAVCPECGSASRTHSGIAVRDATMSVEAPTWYVRHVRNGVLFCVLGVLCMSLFGVAAGWFAGVSNPNRIIVGFCVLARLFGAAAWCAGVWMITKERSGLGELSNEPTLDNESLRKAIRWLSFAVPFGVLLSGAGSVSGGVPTLLGGFIAFVWLGAWIGLVPLGVYCSSLAYWASDESISSRLGGTTWVMCAAGVIRILANFTILIGLPIEAPARLVVFLMNVTLFLATAFLLLQIVRLASVLSWVIQHQRARAGSAARVREKIKDRVQNPDRVGQGVECEVCGYALDGLPVGGACPECGESYADLAPKIFRNTAQTPVSEDAIEFETDDDALFGFSVPKAPIEHSGMEVPEEGDIPIVDEQSGSSITHDPEPEKPKRDTMDP